MPDSKLEETARRARRRWLITMGVVAVVVAVAIPLLNPLIEGRPRRVHHHGGVAEIVVPVVIIVIALAVLFIIGRKTWRNQGMFAAPLISGLSWRDRRRAARAVRRGEPSADAHLAEVERATAERAVRQARVSTVVFIVALALEVIEAITQDRTGARIFFSVSAVFFLAMLGLMLHTVRGARRYLSRV